MSVHHVGERANHFLNHDLSLSRIGLGCVLEALSIGASLEGLTCDVKLSLDGPKGAPWAVVRFKEARAEPHLLAEAVFRRATDRRSFWGGSLPAALRAELMGGSERGGDAGVYILDEIATEFIDYLVDCDAYILKNSAAMRDVAKYLRYSQREREATRDGMPWASIGLPIPEVRGLELTRFPLVHKLIERLRVHSVTQAWYKQGLRSAGALLCFTVRSREMKALVAGGRLGYLAWLRLNAAGWGVQPISFSCLPIYQAALGHEPPRGHEELGEIAEIGRHIVPRHFGYPAGELPIWILRTGLTTPQRKSAKALRRNLDDILVWEGP